MLEFDPAVLLGLRLAILAILADTVIGWILAATRGKFDIRLVPKFLRTSIAPYIGVLLVLALMTVADPAYIPVFYFVCAIVTAKFGVEAMKDKLTRFFKPADEPPSN